MASSVSNIAATAVAGHQAYTVARGTVVRDARGVPLPNPVVRFPASVPDGRTLAQWQTACSAEVVALVDGTTSLPTTAHVAMMSAR